MEMGGGEGGKGAGFRGEGLGERARGEGLGFRVSSLTNADSKGVAPDRRQVSQEDQLMLSCIVKTWQQAFLSHAGLQVLGALADRHQL